MAGIICDNGILVLNNLLGPAMVADGHAAGLYTNNHTPALGDAFAAYTEATFGGYAQVPLASPVSGGVTADIAKQTFAPVTFTATGSGLPVTVYGYFIVRGTKLIGAELFVVPITLSTAGQAIVVVPSLTYQDRSVP